MESGVFKIIKDLYGVIVSEQENPVVSSLSTTAAKILQAKPRRLGFIIVNLSSVSVYVSMANNPSSTKGILLGANGGSLSVDWQKDFTLPSREWYGVAASGTANIYIIELIQEPDSEK